jgi:pilus assembly protein Flp/PilA
MSGTNRDDIRWNFLIAGGISVAIIAVVNGLGTKLNATLSSISSQLK